jgi:acyl-ACP thioesterase
MPHSGRRYELGRHVLLSDTTPDGRMRLDAIARVLHDVATLDNTDAPLVDKGLWVIRSIELEITAWPRYLDALEVATAVSGTGRAWAERRTDLAVGGETLVAAAALWVNTRADTGAPATLPTGFDEVYGEAAGGRRVRPTLEIARPERAPDWQTEAELRRADLDIIDHVNNAVHLALVEEALWRADREDRLSRPARVRIEFPRGLAGTERAALALWEHAGEILVEVADAEGPSSLTRIAGLVG